MFHFYCFHTVVIMRVCFAWLHLFILLSSAFAWVLPGPLKQNTKTLSDVQLPPQSEMNTRRQAFSGIVGVMGTFLLVPSANAVATIDVNNAMAREFTAFPGLYPTVATKIVNAAKEQPFGSKKEVYTILSETEQERLRVYDKSIIIAKPDRSLQQFKASQICKYECGSRTSNSYRDEQIKAVQSARSR